MEPREPSLTATFGALGFPETPWTVVLRASERRESNADAQAALGRLCEAYRPVILRYFGIKDFANAEDLAHDFLCRWLGQQGLGAFSRRPSTLFRKYLATALRHFWADHLEARRAAKRGAGQVPASLEQMQADHDDLLPAEDAAAADAIDREVALMVHRRAVAEVAARCTTPGQRERLSVLEPLLLFDADRDAYGRAGERLKLGANALQQALFRLRQDYFDCFRTAVGSIARADEVDVEMRHLLMLLPTALAEVRSPAVVPASTAPTPVAA